MKTDISRKYLTEFCTDQQSIDFVKMIESLGGKLTYAIEDLELQHAQKFNKEAKRFKLNKWDYEQGSGGGNSFVLAGNVFEKGAVNLCSIVGNVSPEMKSFLSREGDFSEKFWVAGISIIFHPVSPLVPMSHMNLRYFVSKKSWFGGVADLTPVFPVAEDTEFFLNSFKAPCDDFDKNCYNLFRKNCDEYFFLPHRNEMRGIGGVFYDRYESNDFNKMLEFNKKIGESFINAYYHIAKKYINKPWTQEEKHKQLLKRGRYIEFNLLYDRGTAFGLKTKGNINSIFSSLPPHASWE